MVNALRPTGNEVKLVEGQLRPNTQHLSQLKVFYLYLHDGHGEHLKGFILYLFLIQKLYCEEKKSTKLYFYFLTYLILISL